MSLYNTFCEQTFEEYVRKHVYCNINDNFGINNMISTSIDNDDLYDDEITAKFESLSAFQLVVYLGYFVQESTLTEIESNLNDIEESISGIEMCLD